MADAESVLMHPNITFQQVYEMTDWIAGDIDRVVGLIPGEEVMFDRVVGLIPGEEVLFDEWLYVKRIS